MNRWLCLALALCLAAAPLAAGAPLDGQIPPGALEAPHQASAALRLDETRSRVVVDFAVERPGVRYLFESGTLYPVLDGEGREVGAVFLGRGTLSYSPDDPLQQRQLYQFTWFNTALTEGFTRGLILYTGLSPLPSTGWQGRGADPKKAARVLMARWQRLNTWAGLTDQGDIWEHSRAPNLLLDLIEDRIDAVDGPGMRFVEVNAHPPKRSLYRRPTPNRWWVALYESPRGAQPVFRTADRGVLFMHGDQQGRWLNHVFYAYEPPAYGPSSAVDVYRSDHHVTMRWDSRMERLHLDQQVQLELRAEGSAARLLLAPREPQTGATIVRHAQPALQVEAVVAGGAELPFLQRNGEVLLLLPGGFDGRLSVRLRSDLPLSGGAQRGDGPFALWHPLGTYFDRAVQSVRTSGPAGFTVVASQNLAQRAGVEPGTFEPPSLTLGQFVEASFGDDTAKVWGYAFKNQLLTPFEAEDVAALMVREGARALSFFEPLMGSTPFTALSFVESRRGYDPLGLVPMSPWTLRAQDQESRLDAFRNRAYVLSAQWWGNGVALADPLEDYWLFSGLQSFLANWAMEATLAPSNWLDQHLDEWRRKALDAERPVYRAYLASGGGLETQALGVSARGYLLFNNLRHAVGDDAMARALRAVYTTFEGKTVTADAFIAALGEALGFDLGRFLDPGLPVGPYTGSMQVVYSVVRGDGGTLFQAVTDGADPGPTLGASVRVHLSDGRSVDAFVPLGGGAELRLDADVRRVEIVKRGCGLVRHISAAEFDGPLWIAAEP